MWDCAKAWLHGRPQITYLQPPAHIGRWFGCSYAGLQAGLQPQQLLLYAPQCSNILLVNCNIQLR